jgi:hypothetical protein
MEHDVGAFRFAQRQTATMSFSARARRIKLAWPSCKNPIVGTNPTVRPASRSLSSARCVSAIRVSNLI